MGKKFWVVLLLVIGIFLTTLPNPALTSQLTLYPDETNLYSYPTGNSQSAENLVRGQSELEAPGRNGTPQDKKAGMDLMQKLEPAVQWAKVLDDGTEFPSAAGTTVQSLLQIHPIMGDNHSTHWHRQLRINAPGEKGIVANKAKKTHDGDRETNISGKQHLSSQTGGMSSDTTDTWGPVPLPIALLLLGSGILGILSVRRTNDHSNVA